MCPGPLSLWGEGPGSRGRGSQALWPAHGDVSSWGLEILGLGLQVTLGKPCPSLALRITLCAVRSYTSRDSATAAAVTGLRFGGSILSVDLLLLLSTHCSLVAFLSHSSGPWIRGLKA